MWPDWFDWLLCKYYSSDLYLLWYIPPTASKKKRIKRSSEIENFAETLLELSVCLLGGPSNSYSTHVCETITGLRQWRFCLTTIGGNTAAEKCVSNSSRDEPQEKIENKGNCLEVGVFSCTLFGVPSFAFHVSFIPLLSVRPLPISPLSPGHPHTLTLPLPLPPCSTCLSKLGRARYTHSTGGGPCLLSINNLWNSEIQVGPVSGRLYHTLEGGLPGAHDNISICFWHSLSVCLRRSDGFWVHHNGWSNVSRLLQLFLMSESSGGSCGYPLWAQFLYGLHQWLLEWSWLHRDLHLPSV